MRSLVAIVFSTLALAANIDPDREILARWPVAEPAAVGLLREAGVNSVLVPPPEDAAPFLAACRSAGITPIAELSLTQNAEVLQKDLAKVRAAGFGAAAIQAFGDERTVRSILDSQGGFISIVVLTPEQIRWNVAPACALLKAGQWPGQQTRDLAVAGATVSTSFSGPGVHPRPWLEANSYLIASLRGWFPGRPAVLGYQPDKGAGVSPDRVLRSDSADLALADAFSAGGSVVLSFPDSFRRDLLAGEKRALSGWRALASSISFVKKNRALVSGQSASQVAVAAGTLEESGEMLSMLYRNNLCPAVFAVERVPTLNPARLSVMVAVNTLPSQASSRNLAAFASAGGRLFASPATAGSRSWWLQGTSRKARSEDQWDQYAVGGGGVFVYKSTVQDASEFAFDVIDVINRKNLDLRIWNAESVLGVLHRSGGGKLVLALVNYGSVIDHDFLVYVRGQFRGAELIEPGSEEPRPVKLTRRPQGAEINLDHLGRTLLLVLSEGGA